jgi:hypothetical protein
MTQKPNNPINLSVHEISDPRDISRNPEQETSADVKDLNDSVHDDENVDTPNPGLLDNGNNGNPVNSQISIANLSAG